MSLTRLDVDVDNGSGYRCSLSLKVVVYLRTTYICTSMYNRTTRYCYVLVSFYAVPA